MSDETKAETSVEPTDKNTNAEAARYRKRFAESKAKVAELEARLADVEVERDDALNKLKTAPGEAAARIAELEGQIRTRTHKDAWAKAAEGKIKPTALEDAYNLSGWQADADEIDEAKLTETIDTLLASREYLRAEAQSPVEESTTPAPVERSFSLTGHKPKPVSGAGRGPAPESTPKHSKTVYRL
ncbi:hypothetical protein [Paludisphaera rhizosphaerae]|uniref:hypothetical protein n=1 Tax=Paludisphaera rhizosphaerae TaxID=2711216 RepID=UPI0013EBC602|nr:hypothetical protein [Paludisphaera rhizosphaerae]